MFQLSQRTTPERRATARAAAAAAARAECTFRPATNEAASRQLLSRIVAGRAAGPPLEGPGFGSPGPGPAPAEAEAARSQVPWQPEAGCGAGRLAANPSPGRRVAGDGWEPGPAASDLGASPAPPGQWREPSQVSHGHALQAGRWSGGTERVEIGDVSGDSACLPGEAWRAQSCTDSTRISTVHSSLS